MTNWIIISDVHMDVFEGRLPLYIKLAHDLVDVCKKNNSTELVIAGDIINSAVTPPTVLHTLARFLDILKEGGIHVSYLCGQHDWALKDINGDMDQTYLSLEVFNMDYVGGTHKKVEGLDIYFHNYDRTNLVKVPDCDILIGHVSLGFQQIDDSNFKVGICGDIHKPIKIGKCISISPPMQIHPSEPQQGYYVLLSMDNGHFKCSRGLMPQIFKLDPPQRLKVISKPKEIVEKDFDIPDEIVKEIDMSNMPQPIDLNFRLKRLTIKNFKFWKSYDLNFDSQKIFISGRNGKGKSTLLYALYYSFIKSRNEFDQLRVNFEYQNHDWIISRSSEASDNHIYKDGVEILVKSKNAFEDKILELFPFIKLLDFFFVETYHHFFDCDRIRLFEELFDLKSYAYLANQAKGLIRTYERKSQDMSLRLATLSGQIKSLDSELIDISIDRDDILNRLTQLKDWNKKLSQLQGMEVTTQRNIDSEEQSIAIKLENKDELIKDQQDQLKRSSLTRSISNIKNKIIVCPECGARIGAGNVDELEAELASLPEPKFDQGYIRQQLALIESREKTVEELRKNREFLQKIKDRITELQSRVNQNEIDDLQLKLNLFDKNEATKKKIIESKEEYDKLKGQSTHYLELKESCEKFLDQVDIKNPDSIPVKKIQEITKAIETEHIKFSILSELKNGNEKLDIQLVYNGYPYDECSQGERTLLDLHLLSCITRSLGGVGFVVLDESLSVLDPKNYINAQELIEDINANNILMTSHKEGFNFFDKLIDLGD